MTPYERGYSDRRNGEAGPRHVPRGDASWSEKLYWRGWCDAANAPSAGVMAPSEVDGK